MTFRAPSLPTYFISLLIAGAVGGLAWLIIGDNALALLAGGLLIGHFFGSFLSDTRPASAAPTATRTAAEADTHAASSTPAQPARAPAPAPVVTRPPQPNDGEIKSIYVGNVAFNAPRGALQSLFEEYGEVISVRLMTDRVTRRPRGYGFVEMESSAALAAIEALDGAEFFNRTLRVNEAKQRAPYRGD